MKFNIKAEALNISLNFNFDGIKYSFTIPDDAQFSITNNEIYPMPKNILYGGVVYNGEENTVIAQEYKNEINKLGFQDIIVPNFDKIPVFNVDSLGVPTNSSWPPDNYSLNFVCSMPKNFKEAFDLALKYYDQNPKINIFISSSNGDYASLSQLDGVTVIFR